MSSSLLKSSFRWHLSKQAATRSKWKPPISSPIRPFHVLLISPLWPLPTRRLPLMTRREGSSGEPVRWINFESYILGVRCSVVSGRGNSSAGQLNVRNFTLFWLGPYVLAQPEMEKRRFPLVKIPPLRGGG